MTLRAHILALTIASTSLGGCVAVAIPVVAGTAIGKTVQHVRTHHRRPAVQTAFSPTVPDAQPIRIEQGALPPPSSAPTDSPGVAGPAPHQAADRDVSPANGAPSRRGWSEALHYVATLSRTSLTHSALLVPGSDLSHPQWVACGDKPMAVIASLDSVTAADLDYIQAMETIGLTMAYASTAGLDVVHTQLAGLHAKGMAQPSVKSQLFVGTNERTVRAQIGAEYCVVAIVGTKAADFPNSTPPGAAAASPGWFLASPE